MEQKEFQKVIEEIWGDERPIHCFCPLCGLVLESDGVGQFARSSCSQGHYWFQSQGSYASRAAINIDGIEERFWFDDMSPDNERFDKRIKQLKDDTVELDDV